MHGNVSEWCWDGYNAGYYAQWPAEDPRGTDGAAVQVFRGGGWNFVSQGARSALRNGYWPGYRGGYLGFRLARVQGKWIQAKGRRGLDRGGSEPGVKAVGTA